MLQPFKDPDWHYEGDWTFHDFLIFWKNIRGMLRSYPDICFTHISLTSITRQTFCWDKSLSQHRPQRFGLLLVTWLHNKILLVNRIAYFSHVIEVFEIILQVSICKRYLWGPSKGSTIWTVLFLGNACLVILIWGMWFYPTNKIFFFAYIHILVHYTFFKN